MCYRLTRDKLWEHMFTDRENIHPEGDIRLFLEVTQRAGALRIDDDHGGSFLQRTSKAVWFGLCL